MRSTPFVTVAALVVALALAAPAGGAACADEGTVSTELSAKRFRAAVLCVTNRERARRGLRSLRRDARLERAAQRHAADMVKRDFVGHRSPGGRGYEERIRATGYIPRNGAWALGEAFASPLRRDPPTSAFSARQLLSYWLRFSGPRYSLLNRRFRDMGIGVAPGSALGRSTAGATYAADFGFRRV